MFRQTPTRTVSIAALLVALAAYAAMGGFFSREIVIEIAILAILAISLDFAAGFGGMISLCHGAIFGLGAYTFAVMTAMWNQSGFVAAIAAILISSAFGLLVGAVTSKTTGIFFIMATLAFGQMVYVVTFESQWLGGDDGMSGVARFNLEMIGIDLGDSLQFALFAVFCLGVAYAVLAVILRASFGQALTGIHANEDRMRALGLSTWRHKALAFAISSAVAGGAGVIAAQHTQFVSPDMMVWTVSGEVLVVVILGGIGTLVGPAIGAALLVLLKHEISSYTDHWHIFIGIVLIATVLAGGRGVFGQFEHLLPSQRRNA